MWFSMGKGVKFTPSLSPASVTFALEVPRDNDEALRINSDQIFLGWHRGFERDTIVSPTQWQYSHFAVDTLGDLAQICQTGLTLKRPLWASAELLRVTELIKSWNAASPDIIQEDEPVPPSSEEVEANSISEKEELVNV
jgi:capsular polysaccharide biosynthesis protein